jgi:undecaprenyl-diphosphatase
MIFASAVGSAGFVWWMFALIPSVFPARRVAAWQLLLTLGFTFALNDYILKPVFDRPRPFTAIADLSVIDAKPQTPSFPSGHAAMAVAGAITGARVVAGAGWALWPLGFVVAVSRIYSGVHWPSDVLAGCFVGLLGTWFVLGGRVRVARPKTSALYS